MFKKSISGLFVSALLILTPCLVQAGELHEAVRDGDSDRVQTLIERGADVNAVDKRGKTPLHYVTDIFIFSKSAGLAIAEILIANGADVNAKTEGGISDEHNLREVQLLSFGGFSFEGSTPLHLAYRHLDISKILIANGADVNAKDVRGRTALHMSIIADQVEVMVLLVENGAEVDKRSLRTAKNLAKDPKIIEYLEENKKSWWNNLFD